MNRAAASCSDYLRSENCSGLSGLPKTDRKLLHDIMAMGFNDTMLQKPLILRLAAECEAGKEEA